VMLPTKFNIKTRILVFVILFELIAYSTIQLFNNFSYSKELRDLKHQAIHETILSSIGKVNSQSQLMERNAQGLGLAGEQLYALHQQGILSVDQLRDESIRILTANFSGFPKAIGGGLWFEPYILDPQLRYFGPYVFRKGENIQFSWDLNTAEYDYHNQSWYQIASKNNWGRDQSKFRPLIWTPPYYDDAGTYALMMTVDAVMFDDKRKVIGMSTVDWALTELTHFLETVKISENSYPFLIHKGSQKFLSYPKNPQMVMKSVYEFNWGRDLLQNNQINRLNEIQKTIIDEEAYNIYFYTTANGFIFGSLMPLSDLENEVNRITNINLIAGGGIGLSFILLMLIIMRMLFAPFDKVLELIKHSIVHKTDGQSGVEIHHIEYDQNNEFTPIVEALDDVYRQVKSYMAEIMESNNKLLHSKGEVNALNRALEAKVALRTEQLEAKTLEALASLELLKNTQQQFIEHEKHAALGRLVAGVAHEINTPLGIAVTAASTVETEIRFLQSGFAQGTLKKRDFEHSSERLNECAEILNANLERAADLISSFKQVAVDQSSDQFRRFNLFDYMTRIITSLRPKVGRTEHKIEFDCSCYDIEIYSIPGVLAQVVTNLVDNALLHGLANIKHGKINIYTGVVENTVKIVVSDNGRGMPKEVRELVFEPFFTTARNTGGTGLGLHIVYNLVVQQLKGVIECESKEGNGTIFTIIFPLPKQKTKAEDLPV
jgi:signal transduction histidine kinase